LSLDANNKITGMRGDRDDRQTLGYACFKGLRAIESHYGAARILHPLKRQPDGSFVRIGLEQALDEIAAALRKVLDENGPEAIGACRGNGAYMNAAAVNLSVDFLQTLGSHKLFSPNTIDQSAKIVAAERLGYWPPGVHPFHGSEVVLMIGGNPLLS